MKYSEIQRALASYLLCRGKGHQWRRQTKAERGAAAAREATHNAMYPSIELTIAPVKICRRCGFEQAINKRKPK